MAVTFYWFSDLPRELRDQIWKFAIRKAHPGVQIFRLYKPQKHYDDLAQGDLVSSPCCWNGHHLAAPLWDGYFDNIDPNCSDRNASTYLINGGLWTACKESRLVMKKHFRSAEWDFRRKHHRKELASKESRHLLDMPATGCFACDGAAPHYLTVLPYQDLFVLQTESLESINREHLNFDIPIKSSARGFGGVKNIAIEYNPEWGIQMSKAKPFDTNLSIFRTLIQAAFDVDYYASKIWFIDHNLKRNKDAPAFQEKTDCWGTNAFYASDRKFLEVKCDFKTTGLKKGWQYIQQEGDEYIEKSSIKFVALLIDALEDSVIRMTLGRKNADVQLGFLAGTTFELPQRKRCALA
ncbi:hypothetical protein ACHAPT_010237 [Fusarium lateritium]